MRMKTSLLIALLLISLMAFFSLGAAAEAATDKQSAYNAIESAKQDMQEMQAAGFSVKKVNDTIADAKNIYEIQVMLEQKGEKADYSSVIAKANSVSEIRKDAFETHDALRALDLKLEEASKSQDMSAAIEIFNEAKREFEDERYEQTREAIDRCYEKINELQATLTKIKAIYKASTKTLAGFFARNYKLIIAIILVALVLYFTFKNKVAIYLVNRNIQRLQLEKETLMEMMKKTQFDYFQKGAMPESMYNVRVTKFGELTRDIERRLSIERLELEDIKKRKGKRAEKIRKIAHEPSLRRPKAEIEKARRKEAKKRAKLRKKAEKRRLKEEKKREKEEKKRATKAKGKEERKVVEKVDFGKAKNYVQRTKSKGFSDKQIKAELVRSGWKGRLVKKVLKEVEKERHKRAKEAKKMAKLRKKAKKRMLKEEKIREKKRLKEEKARRKEEEARRKKEEILRLKQEKLRRKEAKKRAKEEKRKTKQRRKEEKKEAKAEEKKEKEERKRLKKLRYEEIKDYVQKTKSKGFSDNEIRAELARRGWQAELIKKAFRAFSEVKEKAAEEKADFKRVKDYVQKTRSIGLAERQTKSELAKGGWQSGFIKKAFREVKKEKRKSAKEEKRKLKREKRIEKQRRKEAKKSAKLRKKAEKARLREKKKSAKQEKKEAAKRRKEAERRAKLSKKEAKKRRKEAKKRAKLMKKAEKARLKEETGKEKRKKEIEEEKFPEPPGFHRKFKKHFERLEEKKLPKEERIRKKKEEKARRKEEKARKKEAKKRAKLMKKAKPREEVARKKEEAREKAEAVRLAERELAITRREERKQEKLARKKAIKRLKEVKKELKRREKKALKQKKELEKKRKAEAKKRKRLEKIEEKKGRGKKKKGKKK